MSAPIITPLVANGNHPIRVTEPGFYLMAPEAYHADPAPEPSLSASIAVTLLDETPMHAWFNHPRLNFDHERDDANDAMNKGSAAHELILGKGAGIAVIDFKDWRTNAAKDAAEDAIAAGLTPLLRKTYDEAAEIANAVIDQVSAIKECRDFFDPNAQSELVMVWQDEGVWCRSMIDRLTPRGIVYDVKTGARGLDNRTLTNKFFEGFEVQPALYRRGLATLWPEMAGRFKWRWIMAESVAPFAVRVEEADETVFGLGNDRVEHALRIWRRCLKANRWPGYAPKVGRLGPPQFAFNRWHERLELPSPNAPLIPEEDTALTFSGALL